MALFRRFLAPNNSLLFAFDHCSDAEGADFIDGQIEEAGKYYRFVSLADLVASASRDNFGFASVLFTTPRKGLFLLSLPRLLSAGIPVTTFVDPDTMGTGTLPLGEELAAYRAAYGDKLPPSRWEALQEEAWTAPDVVNDFLRGARRDLGPLPVQSLDPLRFPVTWGKLVEVPTSSLSVGIRVDSDPQLEARWKLGVRYVTEQMKAVPSIAWSDRSNLPEEALEKIGIRSLVTRRHGAIGRGTPRFSLPVWDPAVSGVASVDKTPEK